MNHSSSSTGNGWWPWRDLERFFEFRGHKFPSKIGSPHIAEVDADRTRHFGMWTVGFRVLAFISCQLIDLSAGHVILGARPAGA